MAAASGMPGMETTPTAGDGPGSSLTAIGPEHVHQIGSSPAAASGDPDDLDGGPGGQRARGQHVVARRRRGERACRSRWPSRC